MRGAAVLSAVILISVIAGGNGGGLQYYEIVREMGYADVSVNPVEIEEVRIPDEFNKVYLKYNELLKKGGYDLSEYKGKVCQRYTYLIPSVNARANVLVHNGTVIGGDISGITLDGIMIPLKRSEGCAT